MCVFGHIGNSIALWAIFSVGGSLTPEALYFAVIFGILPDIDCIAWLIAPNVYYGKSQFSHRQLTHGVVGLSVALAIAAIWRLPLALWPIAVSAFSLHILLDMLVYSERRPMRPFYPLHSVAASSLNRLRWISYTIMFYSLVYSSAAIWAAYWAPQFLLPFTLIYILLEVFFISRSRYAGHKSKWLMHEQAWLPDPLFRMLAWLCSPVERRSKSLQSELPNG